MFSGFSDETFEFFMALSFNNNRDFFQQNRDWYLRAVRNPCLELAKALIPVMEDIDPGFETRPWRAVSRINRDIRFSLDKSPYRDYMWLSYHRSDEDKEGSLGFYFDISAREGSSYGMGFYGKNMPRMNAFRRELRLNAEPFWAALSSAADFRLSPNTIKRMKVPEELPEAAKVWYPLRSFYLSRDIRDFAALKSPALADELKRGYKQLKDLYRYFINLNPIEEDYT